MNQSAQPVASTIEILRKLVSFDTTSRHPNAPLIEWIGDYLNAHGVPFTLSRGPEDGKWNLHAILGTQGAGGLAFSGHVDCVPVDGQNWSSDPFTLREQDGKLYGRGAADMKGFVAAMLAAIPRWRRQRLDKPVHLLITFDEEITCNGARYLMDDIIGRGLRPELCVVGEPTMMTPVIAHKGRLALRVNIVGRAAHSSHPEQGANAVHAMGRAIAIVADEAERFAREGLRVDGFSPPYTTMQAGLASGGAILNIVPEKASFDVEWRCVPGDKASQELARLQHFFEPFDEALRQYGPECGFFYEPLVDLPPLALSQDHPLTELVRQVTGSNQAGFVSYGTEAGIYQQAGMASIVCGPGDIAQAHKPDEWIAISQLERCDDFLQEMVRRVCVLS
ncbi:acetylornithine deacetylase [Kozakia baliensis]|uniref:acetylornithine deacetylase n=1 Tax=Kozakia baliensis TaxID=153496 RepID=UPI000495CF2D|nr:acetylornithine deacetylase [Kozakia baliensis]